MRRSLPHLIGAASIVLLVASGCAPESTEPEVPELWRAQIDQLLAGEGVPITDAHRQILADHAISDAEYEELRQQLSDCLTGHGIEHELLEGGGLRTTSPADEGDSSQTDQLTDECMFSTTGPVEPIYLGMRENPDGIGEGEALRRCLDTSDVAEFAEVSADELERQILSAELEPTTPEAMLCTLDPFGSQGVTLDRAREILTQEQGEVVAE